MTLSCMLRDSAVSLESTQCPVFTSLVIMDNSRFALSLGPSPPNVESYSNPVGL